VSFEQPIGVTKIESLCTSTPPPPPPPSHLR
jgi:hypothetical protein